MMEQELICIVEEYKEFTTTTDTDTDEVDAISVFTAMKILAFGLLMKKPSYNLMN
jgi:hypothetical protein